MAARSEKIEFPGSQGAALAARLDLPPGAPVAYALFAHCFTCSKDIFAAARVSAALAERGIACLRFDFTGLGASEGEFANTDFSSNVADLVAAANYLREAHEAPSILVGHSLGFGPQSVGLFVVDEFVFLGIVVELAIQKDRHHRDRRPSLRGSRLAPPLDRFGSPTARGKDPLPGNLSRR